MNAALSGLNPSMPSTGGRDSRAITLLHSTAYRWYLVAMVASLLASEFQTVAIWLQVYESTGDPLSLGLIGVAGLIPFASTVLIAGHVADRFDRRRVTLWSLSALIVCTASLLALTLGGIASSHLWTVYAVVGASGIARSFLNPARGALGAELVPTAQLEQGARLRSTVFQIGSVAGRSLSGFVYAFGISLGLGASFTYGVVVVLLIGAVLGTLAIQRIPPVIASAGEPMLQSLANGVRFVVGSRILVGAMVLDLLGVLFGDAIILLPFFADRILHVGPQGLGLLRAAPSVGAVLMALLLARRPTFTYAGPTLLLAVAGFGVAQAGFGLSPWVALSATCLILSGALDFISVLMRGAMVQVLTPTHLMGRVMSVQQVFIWSSNELGAFEAGFAARLLGLVPSVVVGGAITIAVTGLTAWLNPTLRRLRRITPEAAGTPEGAPSKGQATSVMAGPAAPTPPAE